MSATQSTPQADLQHIEAAPAALPLLALLIGGLTVILTLSLIPTPPR